MLSLETIEVSLFGPTTQEERNAACLEAVDDFDAVFILNSSGFQGSVSDTSRRTTFIAHTTNSSRSTGHQL